LLDISIYAQTVPPIGAKKAGTEKAALMTEIKKAPKTAVIEAWEHAQLFAKEIRSPFRFVRADLKAAQPSEIRRTDLLRNDLSARGREAVQVRVDFDPGAVFPKRSHPGRGRLRARGHVGVQHRRQIAGHAQVGRRSSRRELSIA